MLSLLSRSRTQQEASPQRQPLREALGKQIWRKRRRSETEAAVLADSTEPAQEARLRSFKSEQETALKFTNASNHHVRAIWLTFDGDEMPYTILVPGETRRYHTYVGHPWIFRDAASERRMNTNQAQAVVGSTGETVVVVHDPPLLPWQETTHCAFPATFKQEVATTLLCYHRLGSSTAPSSQAVSMAVDGCCYRAGSLAPAGPSSSSLREDAACGSGGSLPQDAPTTTLGALTLDLVFAILQHMVPPIWQDIRVPGGHPDVQPCTWTDAKSYAQLLKYTEAVCGKLEDPGKLASGCMLQ